MWLSFPLQALCLLEAATDCRLGVGHLSLSGITLFQRERGSRAASLLWTDVWVWQDPSLSVSHWPEVLGLQPWPRARMICILFCSISYWSCALLSRQRSCKKQRKKRTSHHAVRVALNVEKYQFSRSVVSDSLRPHGLQHTRLPCPSPTPGVCSNSCPSSRWYHPTISSSVIPLSSCLQSFPVSRSFPMSQFFASGGWSIGTSAWTLVLPMIIQDWFPIGLSGLTSLQSKAKDKNLCTLSSPVIPDFCLFLILLASPCFSSPCFFLHVLCETHSCMCVLTHMWVHAC